MREGAGRLAQSDAEGAPRRRVWPVSVRNRAFLWPHESILISFDSPWRFGEAMVTAGQFNAKRPGLSRYVLLLRPMKA